MWSFEWSIINKEPQENFIYVLRILMLCKSDDWIINFVWLDNYPSLQIGSHIITWYFEIVNINNYYQFLINHTPLIKITITICNIYVFFFLKVAPVGHFPNAAVNTASQRLVQQHNTAFPNEKILMQVTLFYPQ